MWAHWDLDEKNSFDLKSRIRRFIIGSVVSSEGFYRKTFVITTQRSIMNYNSYFLHLTMINKKIVVSVSGVD
jgi:hypothetical protein